MTSLAELTWPDAEAQRTRGMALAVPLGDEQHDRSGRGGPTVFDLCRSADESCHKDPARFDPRQPSGTARLATRSSRKPIHPAYGRSAPARHRTRRGAPSSRRSTGHRRAINAWERSIVAPSRASSTGQRLSLRDPSRRRDRCPPSARWRRRASVQCRLVTWLTASVGPRRRSDAVRLCDDVTARSARPGRTFSASR